MIDFFISYTAADKLWAEGIDGWLKEAGYSTIIQEADFVGGSNFAEKMHEALIISKRTIAVLSQDSLIAPFPMSEWLATFADDPLGKQQKLVPVRIRECTPNGLLKPIRYIDLVGLNEVRAKEWLLQEIGKIVSNPSKKTVSVPIMDISTSKKTPIKRGRNPKKSSEKVQKIEQKIEGNGNIQVGGDYISPLRYYKRQIIQPGSGHISEEQAYKIKTLVDKLVESEGGGKHKKWWSIIQKKYKVTSYHLIPAEQGDVVISWLMKRVGQERNKLRKNNLSVWQKDTYRSIYTRTGKLGMSKDEVYTLAFQQLKLKKPLTSLTELSDAQLKKLYDIVMRMK